MKKLNGKKTGSLVVAKLIAGLCFFGALFFFMVEVFSFAMYVLPLWLTLIAQTVNVDSANNWIVACIVWAFPSLFFTIFAVLVHFYGIRYCLVRLFKWFVRVLRQTGKEAVVSSEKV